VADVFLCASEHEGFCVPIVESFWKGVPVIAFAATAVPATMDGAGLLYAEKDPLHVAELVDAVISNPDLRDLVVDEQYRALDRLPHGISTAPSSAMSSRRSRPSHPRRTRWRSTSGTGSRSSSASKSSSATGPPCIGR